MSAYKSRLGGRAAIFNVKPFGIKELLMIRLKSVTVDALIVINRTVTVT